MRVNVLNRYNGTAIVGTHGVSIRYTAFNSESRVTDRKPVGSGKRRGGRIKDEMYPRNQRKSRYQEQRENVFLDFRWLNLY